MVLSVPTAALSNVAVLPGPATKVTPKGFSISPESSAEGVPSNILSPPVAYTNIFCFRVEPPVNTNLVE